MLFYDNQFHLQFTYSKYATQKKNDFPIENEKKER